MKPDLDRDALIEEMTQKFKKQLQQKMPHDNATLDQIEQVVEEIGTDIQRQLQDRLVHQRTKKPRENRLACACGGQALYKKWQTRHLLTRHAVLCWNRPYYYCARCQRGRSPLDATLGLDEGQTTTQVRLWCADLAQMLPFEEAVASLSRLTGIHLGAATLEQIAVGVGTSLCQAQSQEANQHQSNRLPERRTACPRRLYIGVDGVFVPLREPWKHDGSQADLACRYAECKVGVVYETDQDETGKEARVKKAAYTATLDKVKAFTPRIATLAHRCGHHAAKEVVVIGDGAAWIWLLAYKQFPGALQIVDFYHACEHLAQVAEARFGAGTQESKAWQSARQVELKTNQVDRVLCQILAWKPKTGDDRQLRRQAYHYFHTNAERMRYKTFLEKGYHIGSGVVEATCKHVVASRLDQAGMHWREASAEAILTLRAAMRSSEPPDLRPHCAVYA